MIVNFDCEFCGRGQAAPASKAGRTVPCRYCGGDCEVPRGEEAPNPPAPENVQAGHAIGTPVSGTPRETIGHSPDPFRPQGQESAAQGGSDPYAPPRADPGYGSPGNSDASINNAATAALVLAIVGWVSGLFCGPFALIFCPLAIWQAMRARSLARTQGLEPPGLALAALIIAGSLIALIVLGVVLFVVAVALSPQ